MRFHAGIGGKKLINAEFEGVLHIVLPNGRIEQKDTRVNLLREEGVFACAAYLRSLLTMNRGKLQKPVNAW